ncbi:MAG: type III pantothenate kinase [Gammaproteobacteria bacterium]|nr:type III pantothenate kinase [Gammaproteobacteria bacterium]
MLLLDLGNSSLKAQFWQSYGLQSSCYIRIEQGWQRRFDHFLQTIDVHRCYCACVPGSQATVDVDAILYAHIDSEQCFKMSARQSCDGVVNGYSTPEGMGVDRWLALLGAADIVERDVIIVDAGSAITVDLLRNNGQHLGGAILPGFDTSIWRFRHMLSMADFDHCEISSNQSPGSSTESCIHINYSIDTSAYLNQLIMRWFKLLADDAVLVVTGGDARQVEQPTGHDYRQLPDLVFRGMHRQLEARE